MGKILTAVALAGLFLHWLAARTVMVPVNGVPVAVPMLVVAVIVVILTMAAVLGTLAALMIYRTRAEQTMLAAWQARSTATRPCGRCPVMAR